MLIEVGHEVDGGSHLPDSIAADAPFDVVVFTQTVEALLGA
jgi:hypothetical protein